VPTDSSGEYILAGSASVVTTASSAAPIDACAECRHRRRMGAGKVHGADVLRRPEFDALEQRLGFASFLWDDNVTEVLFTAPSIAHGGRNRRCVRCMC